MSAQDIIFVLLAVVTGGAAVLTVTSRNLVHAALFLGTALAGIGGLFLLMQADFVGLVQVVVYLGAITVLFLFGLMLTRAPIGREALDSANRPMALVVSAALFGVLVVLIVRAFQDVPVAAPTGMPLEEIGLAIFSTWVFPFELVSLLLLGALVGAVLLSRRETGESGEETPISVVLHALPSPGEQEREQQRELTPGGDQ